MAKNAWTSQIAKVVNRMEGDAMRSGLKASGVLLQEIIQARLEQGYTTGAWVKGVVAKSVIRSRPGRFSIRVFTKNPVAIQWESGHHNIFTRRFERVEVWRPAVEQNVEALRRAFAKRFLAKLNELAHKKLLPAIGA